MATAFNDKYGRYKTKLGDTLVQFNTIMNIPFKIAYDMYIRDEWFDKPYESKTFADEIYVTIVKKDDNLNVEVFNRRNRPDDAYFVEKPDEKKVFDFLKQGTLPPKKIINICYAVMRAKDIYLFFVDYIKKYHSFPVSQDRLNYLYHSGWVMSSEPFILENDELVKFLNKKMYGDKDIDIKSIQLNLKTSFDNNTFFETEYYKKFLEMFKEEKFEFNPRMIKESEIANLYINTIFPENPNKKSLSGGKKILRKKSIKHKKKSIKKKTIKK